MPPKLQSGSSVVEVVENETVTLECPVQGADLQLQWTRNGVPVVATSNLQVNDSISFVDDMAQKCECFRCHPTVENCI